MKATNVIRSPASQSAKINSSFVARDVLIVVDTRVRNGKEYFEIFTYPVSLQRHAQTVTYPRPTLHNYFILYLSYSNLQF